MALHTDAFAELDRELRFFPLGVDDPRTLSREQIAHYNDKGYVYPIDIFSAAEIAEIRRYFDGLLESAQAAGWNSYEMTNWHKQCRGVWDIVTEGRILDYIEDLLGETVILRHSHFFAKLPGDGKRVSWHQDASYWPLSPSKVVSAWLAIDDVDVGNGALHVIPGSHRDAQIAFADSAPEENNVLQQTVPDAEAHGDAGGAGVAGRADLAAQRLDPARLGAQRVHPATLRPGDALPLVGRAGVPGLEPALDRLPGRGTQRPLGEPPAARVGRHPGEGRGLTPVCATRWASTRRCRGGTGSRRTRRPDDWRSACRRRVRRGGRRRPS